MPQVSVLTHHGDEVKRTNQPTGQYKINPNPNPKCVLIYYAINAGPFFSLDPTMVTLTLLYGVATWPVPQQDVKASCDLLHGRTLSRYPGDHSVEQAYECYHPEGDLGIVRCGASPGTDSSMLSTKDLTKLSNWQAVMKDNATWRAFIHHS